MSAFLAIVVRVVRGVVRGVGTDQGASDLRRVRVVRVVRGLFKLAYVPAGHVCARLPEWRIRVGNTPDHPDHPDHRSVAVSGLLTPLAAGCKATGGGSHVTGSVTSPTDEPGRLGAEARRPIVPETGPHGARAGFMETDRSPIGRFHDAATGDRHPHQRTQALRACGHIGVRLPVEVLPPCSGRYSDAPLDGGAS